MHVRRDAELEKLHNIWDKAGERGRILIMVGPNGSGKTHLLSQFASEVGAKLLYYRIGSGEEKIPMGAIGRFAQVYFPEVLGSRLNMFSTFDKLLKSIGEIAPAIVYFRDVNHADPLSLKFLQHFSLNAPPGVLLVLSYPTGDEGMELSHELEKLVIGENADILSVDNLTQEQVRVYLNEMGLGELSEKFYRITQGNLAFLELLLRCHNMGKKRVKSKYDALRCMYVNLTKGEKEVVNAGAVMGNFFWNDVLEDVLGKVNTRVINSLIKKRIIANFSEMYPSGMYEGYVFVRQDFRDFVYEMMDENTRKNLHKRVARSMERRKKYAGWERVFELANHYSAGGDVERAIKYLKKAVEITEEARDYESTVHYLKLLENYINMKNDDHIRVWLYYSMMLAAENAGNSKLSIEYGEKLKIFSEIGKARTYMSVGNYKKAIAMCNRMLRCGDEYLKMLAYEIIAASEQKLGLYTKAWKTQKKHIELAEKMGNEVEMAIGYKNMGNIYMSMMNYEESKRYYSKAMDIFRKTGNTLGIASIYNNLGIVFNDLGITDEALDYYRKCLELYEKLRYLDGLAIIYNNIGTAYENRGDFYNAIAAYRKSIEYTTLVGDVDNLNYAYTNMANILAERGNFSEALEYAFKELDIAEKMGSVKFRIGANVIIANIFYFTGRYEESMDYAKRAIRIGARRKNYYDSADAYYYIAKVYHAMGNAEECARWAEKALEAYRKIGIEDRASHIYSLLTRCKGKKVLEEMERVVKVYHPEDQYQIWMAKIISLAKEDMEHWAYLDRVVEGLKQLNKLATLADFLEEYYKITGYENIREELERIKSNFVYR